MFEGFVYVRACLYPEGVVLPAGDAAVSVWDRGFVFGDGVYEVVRAYGGRWFRMREHLRRLRRSLEETRIGFDEVDVVEKAAGALQRVQELEEADGLLYVQITRGAAPRSHAFPDPPAEPTVLVALTAVPDFSEEVEKGVAVVTREDFRWHRCDIKTIALQGNVLALQEAKEAGAKECLFVRDGAATEGSHSNFFGVKDGVLRTHPADRRILAGITRECVLELAREAGVSAEEAAIGREELAGLEEAFLTATSFEVVPVVQMDGRPIGDGKPGPVTRRLQEAFRECVRRETGGA